MADIDFGRQIQAILLREQLRVRDAKEEYILEFMQVNNLTLNELLRDYELEETTEWPDFEADVDTNTYSYTATTHFRLRRKDEVNGG